MRLTGSAASEKVHLAALLMVVLILISPGAAQKPETVPHPLATSGQFVGDGAGVLGPDYTSLIDGLCRRLKAATTVEMAVITVRDLGGTTVDDFAEKLFRRFGIGVKGKDNGILILFALLERSIRIEVGYGLEPIITDAESSHLLDTFAIPFLKNDEFGRGLFALAKETALAIAKAQSAALDIQDPAAWPAQVPSPKVEAAAPTKSGPKGPSGQGPVILAALFMGWGILGMALVLLRYRTRRGRAARAKVIDGSKWTMALLLVGALIGFIVFIVAGHGFQSAVLPPLAAFAAGYGIVRFRKSMLARNASYRLPCSKCGSPMDLTPEDQDDALLGVEEAAEEKAGGMDYEIWTCLSCGAQERLSVKLSKAEACPKCKRRSLKASRTILVAATTAGGGRVRIDQNCLNPKCGYTHSVEHNTAKLAVSGSSSGSRGSGGSSRTSFGGGRSGGGGASRRF